jgi:peroxiredoxin/nitrate/TMAO reductase-like tetraheme cytochrome c subunit
VRAPRLLALTLALPVALALLAEGAPVRRERPLPAFEGTTLDGRSLAVGDLLGRRLLVVFFTPGQGDAELLVRAASRLAPERDAHNFQILGVAGGVDAKALQALSSSFPVVRDPSGSYGARVGVRSGAAALLVDAEGYVVRGSDVGGIQGADPAAVIEGELRAWLRLPAAVAGPDLGVRPAAPAFSAPALAGGEPAALESLRGRPAVLVFFLHTCPHCHHALAALEQQLAALPEARRPALVAISVVNRPSDVQASLREAGLDFFPVYADPDERIRAAYGAQAGVPVLFGIDAQGRLAWRVDGWRDQRDPPLLRMRLALLAGEKPPMLLHATGYSGDEFCAACHAGEHDTWLLTAHAEAFETLVRHGAERDAECVGCHVVGFGRPGGYDLAQPLPELEGVGCETCHGRGGPHLSPAHVKGGSYEPVCTGCHDPKHSLGFEYASFVRRISHAAHTSLAGLPTAERQKLLAERRQRRSALLPTRAAYVGSETCRGCHAAEHARWAAHPHAKATATLEREGKASETACRGCHTTGYDKGGFPAGGSPAEHAAFAAVGCESCHGPGGDHVDPDAPKRGTIVSLADKCDSCVILQVCGSCHDQANDPGFEYEVKAKIEAQRHSDRPLATGGGGGS